MPVTLLITDVDEYCNPEGFDIDATSLSTNDSSSAAFKAETSESIYFKGSLVKMQFLTRPTYRFLVIFGTCTQHLAFHNVAHINRSSDGLLGSGT